MQITRQHRKRERLKELLALLGDFQGVVEIDSRLRERLTAENYTEAIAQQAALKEALGTARFSQFPGLLGLQQGMSTNLSLVQQKLSDGLRVAAVSADFNAERYEEILKAYSMLSSDQAISVGKELLRHVSECIVAVSRQCMLAFSAAPSHESPADWHRKAQLRDLCRSMDPAHFVSCAAQLYEHLCDFLYRHQFLCAWHVCRSQTAESENSASEAGFREVLRHVLTELVASKRNVWDRIQQQVSLVLMTLDFQYPALTEDSFMHVLHLTQMLIEEGDAFMADYQTASKGASAESRRQWSAPIRNTLKTKAHDYFQSLHFNAWTSFKVAHIEQDSWQRLPVARNYSLLRTERLKPALLREARGASASSEQSKPRTSENNPFRNYKPEPVVLPADVLGDELGEDASGRGPVGEAGDEIDEHALLQHWIDDSNSGISSIGSSMLSNSNRSPVVSSSTVELARILERYCRMMGAIPSLALDIFEAAVQLVEFYVHCVLCLFVQDRHLRLLLEDLDVFVPGSDPKLPSRQEAYHLQRLCPELRRATARTREMLSSLQLPESCAANLGFQGSVTGAVLLQVTPFSKLTSPSTLCGLSERCVGVESVRSLLLSMQDLKGQIEALLPKSAAQEAVDRFLQSEEAVASQLRTFVLMYAARDVLEVPDVGRISLDHFSNTLQALRWESKDFSQGSPAAPYVQNLRGQIDELARRIPCAGGGSIPHATQRSVWGWLEVRLMQECCEVLAKCGRKKSPEVLVCLAEDFQAIRGAVQQHFQVPDEELKLLPQDHPLCSTVEWSYLDGYLEAHGYMQNEVGMWCKSHIEYPIRLHKALLEFVLGNNQKAFRQTLSEVEAGIASCVSDEGGSFSQRGF
eukprot:TRINITY_DN105924_c0_g1_i1.p1 TRINITY_DN105924_c0_g1~~TRINITY_DN105924_c0_g1_i1.p1  ORF type:complete len:1007 (-),score=237.50 TRINITY_DN105924_c0_g1_i1:22-2613(-)